ncbi:hypothetical protein V12B01_13550 [Vibrio splendidus 12B01]|nr:hypothetical protein V12B01_13550 [Vibrio splendidus 12B01]
MMLEALFISASRFAIEFVVFSIVL